MTSSYRFGRAAILAGVATTALATGEAALGDTGTAEASADTPYSEIVVTAQKRTERLQEVPASVSVLAAPDLARQGVVRFSDYAARVPGLSLTSVRTGQAQVALRGITTGAAQTASSTAYYIDEAPIGSVNAYTGGSSTTPDLDPSDLRQIEVLKGPQGTLYGAGAVGGLLKFVTTPVDLGGYAANLSAGVNTVTKGEVGFSVRGAANLPIAQDVLGLRVSGFYRRDAGYIDNLNPRVGRGDVNRASVKGGRAVLALKLAEAVRLDFSALGQDTNTTGLNTVDVDAVTLKPIAGDLTQNRQVRESGKVRFRLYNATLRAELGGLDLVSSTTYQHTAYRNVTDGSRSYGVALTAATRVPNIGIRSTQLTRTERWSQELRVGADGVAGGLLDLQGGFYWTRENDSNRIPSFDPFSTVTGATLPLPNIITASILSKYEEYSLFANARVHFGEKFDVLGGVRYSHDKQDYAQDYSGLLVPGGRLLNTGKEKANVATWMVSPRYRFSPNAMIYARAASGYRPGGPNAVPPSSVVSVPATFRPDRLTQYELGFKGSTADGSLSIDAALFHTDWKDIQAQTSAGGFNFIVNGGKARSRGGELTLRYRPAGGLTLGTNVSYIDARLTSPAPAVGGLKGDRLPYVPRWSGSVSADYELALGSGLDARFGGSLNFVSDRLSDYTQRLPKRLSGYATVDLRAGIESGGLSLSVFAKNLTDKRAINVATTAGLAPSNAPGAVYYASYIQPRMVGAEAAVAF